LSDAASAGIDLALQTPRLGNLHRTTAKWDRSDDDASWQPWMDMTFTRMP
jgi:hypothetical protein